MTNTACTCNAGGELNTSVRLLAGVCVCVCVRARPKLPSPVRDHLDRGEGQFITPQPGRDKPHLMKQPGQGRIKSHRAVSCSAICTLPSSPCSGSVAQPTRRSRSRSQSAAAAATAAAGAAASFVGTPSPVGGISLPSGF